MIDRDLAELYGVETKVLNQAVKRNGERFPESFRFQLSKQETYELVTICDRFLIIDDSVYHIGASVKDLGKKWFAVSLMEAQDAGSIVSRLEAESTSFKSCAKPHLDSCLAGLVYEKVDDYSYLCTPRSVAPGDAR